jgi:hypothetical protein
MGSCRLCQGWHAFLQSPGKWAGFPCHDEIVQMASKKQGTIRQLAESAGSPIDFVSAAGTVRVPQNLIS